MGKDLKIQAGDIIFVKPNSVLFKLVRWFTKGKFGHVGLISGKIESHTLVIESDGNGTDINDLAWRNIRKENYAIYRIDGITDDQRTALVKKCLSYVGMAYDHSAWLNFIIGKTWFGEDKQLYCSEMIYRALRSLDLIEDAYHPEKVSPAEIFRLLENKITLVKSVEFP